MDIINTILIGAGVFFVWYWLMKHFIYINFKLHVVLVLLENHIQHSFSEDEINKAIDNVIDNEWSDKELLRAIKTGTKWQAYENFRDLHRCFNYQLIQKRFKGNNL